VIVKVKISSGVVRKGIVVVIVEFSSKIKGTRVSPPECRAMGCLAEVTIQDTNVRHDKTLVRKNKFALATRTSIAIQRQGVGRRRAHGDTPRKPDWAGKIGERKAGPTS
jgi:hypothetical protein